MEKRRKTNKGFFSDLFTKSGNLNITLVLMVGLLVLFGLIMIMTSSSFRALKDEGDSFYYFNRQFIWALLGIVAMFFMSKVDYHFLYKFSGAIWAVSIFLLILVLVPGVGKTINNAQRWVNLGPLSIQPSEIAKIASILFFSRFLIQNKANMQYFWKGTFSYIALIGIVGLLLMCQPHFSCTILIGAIGMVLFYITGINKKHIPWLILMGIGVVILVLILKPYTLERLLTLVQPGESDPQGDGYQIKQSIYAIGSGQLSGLGLGLGRQKYTLPEAHNDFIFAVLCEELGFIGALIVIVLFVILIIEGISIALAAPDMYGTLVAMGITFLIGFEAFVNIAVTSKMLPVTGMPLPFFSYGGTSLAITLAAMGILLNISRCSKKK